jgi:hypothetical protein
MVYDRSHLQARLRRHYLKTPGVFGSFQIPVLRICIPNRALRSFVVNKTNKQTNKQTITQQTMTNNFPKCCVESPVHAFRTIKYLKKVTTITQI